MPMNLASDMLVRFRPCECELKDSYERSGYRKERSDARAPKARSRACWPGGVTGDVPRFEISTAGGAGCGFVDDAAAPHRRAGRGQRCAMPTAPAIAHKLPCLLRAAVIKTEKYKGRMPLMTASIAPTNALASDLMLPLGRPRSFVRNGAAKCGNATSASPLYSSPGTGPAARRAACFFERPVATPDAWATRTADRFVCRRSTECQRAGVSMYWGRRRTGPCKQRSTRV
jgi:hypothetical protein